MNYFSECSPEENALIYYDQHFSGDQKPISEMNIGLWVGNGKIVTPLLQVANVYGTAGFYWTYATGVKVAIPARIGTK